jgi:hypothetical protein
VLKWAGLQDRVEVIVGDSSVVLPLVDFQYSLLLLYCCFTAAQDRVEVIVGDSSVVLPLVAFQYSLLLLYCCFTAALLLLYCCFSSGTRRWCCRW